MRKKKRFLLWLAVAVFLFMPPGGCSPSAGPGPEAETEGRERVEEKRVQAVTTIFPLGDILQQIGGEKAEVTVLLPQGSSPHTFEPTVDQARAVSEAELIVFVGGGLDDWAVKMDAPSPRETRVIELMEELEEFLMDYRAVELEGEEGEHDRHAHEETEGADHHHHGPHDPHVWMDPLLVRDGIAPLLTAELKRILPEAGDYFEENLQEFKEELTALHREIKNEVEGFAQTRFISYHSAWGYFAARYGLEEIASIEEFPGKEPSARWLAALVDLAEEHQIDVIFAEPQLSKRAAEVISEEINGEVLVLDPLGGEGLEGRDSYLELLRYNTAIFRKALK